uniref:Putative secreted protein n=1 Tax=Anopheles darlingi TaxID=43151 RepID=A0A2M4D6A2_ANODA
MRSGWRRLRPLLRRPPMTCIRSLLPLPPSSSNAGSGSCRTVVRCAGSRCCAAVASCDGRSWAAGTYRTIGGGRLRPPAAGGVAGWPRPRPLPPPARELTTS